MDTVTAIAVIIGIVNGAKLAQQADKKPFIYFCVALALGLVFGIVHLFGLNIQMGIIVALASSGLYKTAQVIGGQ